MKSYRFCFPFVVLGMWAGSMCAQSRITTSDLPYLCDFEDDTENANWVFNPGVEQIITDNAWTVGSATAYTGNKSLYVSADNGATNAYNGTNNVLIAYRDVSLDNGKYDIAFDWMGMGNGSNGYLKVVFESKSTSTIKCLGNSVEPSWVGYAVSCMGSNARLNGSDAWQHIQVTINIPKALANVDDTRLLFVWVNNSAAGGQSVAIDNVQLAKASTTGYPNNIHVVTQLNTSTVSWNGNADAYEVLYRKKGEDTFRSVRTDSASVELQRAEYGAYEFWICCVNGTDKTVYTIFPKVFLYETDCFDVLNMYNATFEYGKWDHSTGKSPQGYSRVDFDARDIRSRHTTHYDTTEIDPRTITRQGKRTYGLRTVPAGEFGSVRLGNWGTGSQYESITFSYAVESEISALLLLKYAIVLQNPDHSAASQPRFTLEIRDSYGKQVEPVCGAVDFHAPTPDEWNRADVRALWHEASADNGIVRWQDWRTIGINLEKYVGQELFITFTSYDCDQSGHFGYAYFTLRCSRTDVDGIPWGHDAQTQMFTTPDGFNYAWFNVQDTLFKDTLSIERYFHVNAMDTNKYVCHATYPTNAACGFELYATAKPHNPLAEIQWRWTPHNCQNAITIYNASHIGLTNQITGAVEHDYGQRINNCRWTMPDGTVLQDSLWYTGHTIPIPDEGETLTFGLWAGVYVNDSLFQDSTELTIRVPAIGPIENQVDSTVCEGTYVEFPALSGNCYREEGEYVDEQKSQVTGCDSITTLKLTIIPYQRSELRDTICADGEYLFAGKRLNRTGVYQDTLPAYATACDSIVTLNLVRAERPVITLPDNSLCGGVAGGEALAFNTEHSEWVDSFKVVIPTQGEFVFPARQPDMTLSFEPTDIRANRYTAQVVSYMSWCDTYTDTCSFNINLASNVVEPALGEMFIIKNAAFNDNYDIRSYQWYKDGQLIDGATDAAYYEAGMNTNTEYSVRVTLADGTSLWICPFSYNLLTPIESVTIESISASQAWIMHSGECFSISLPYDHYIWTTMTGQQLSGGNTSGITAPSGAGWYLLCLQGADTVSVVRVVVL